MDISVYLCFGHLSYKPHDVSISLYSLIRFISFRAFILLQSPHLSSWQIESIILYFISFPSGAEDRLSQFAAAAGRIDFAPSIVNAERTVKVLSLNWKSLWCSF